MKRFFPGAALLLTLALTTCSPSPDAEAPDADPSGEHVALPPGEVADAELPADGPSSEDLAEKPIMGDGLHVLGVADAEPASGAIAGSQEAEAER